MLANIIDIKAILLVALIFIPLELIVPLRADQKLLRKQWLNDVVYLLLNGFLISFGLMIVLSGVMALVHPLIPHSWQGVVASQPLWLQVIEVLVLADLGFYWTHRLFHAVPMLWKFHAVHHSIEELDWLAAHRVHPLDQAITKSMSYLPAFALGFSPAAIVIFGLVYKWHALAIHSNTRMGIGPLKWIFASPRFHHWHHANQVEAHDKNFAGQLSVIDLLFGTLHMPGSMPARYGSDDRVPALYHEQLLYPLLNPGVIGANADGQPPPNAVFSPPQECQIP